MVRTKQVVKKTNQLNGLVDNQSDLTPKRKPQKTKSKKSPIKKINESEIGIGLPKIKKPHRFRPGTVAKREIKKYSNSVEDLIAHEPFQRLVREIASEIQISGQKQDPWRFEKSAIHAFKATAQDFLIRMFEDANVYAKHAKRQTVFKNDLRLFVMNQPDLKNYDSVKKERKLHRNKIINTPIKKKVINNEEQQQQKLPVNEEKKVPNKIQLKQKNKQLNDAPKLVEDKVLNGQNGSHKKLLMEKHLNDIKRTEESKQIDIVDKKVDESNWKFTF
jgi:histone H3